MEAAKAGLIVLVRRYLDEGDDIDALDGDPASGSDAACAGGSASGGGGQRRKVAMAALHAAADQAHLQVVELLLLNRGASIYLGDSDGRTALMHAAGHGHVPVVRLLLLSGAAVNWRSRKGTTAFMWAASCGREEVAAMLLGCGAQPCSTPPARGTGASCGCWQSAAPAWRGWRRRLCRSMESWRLPPRLGLGGCPHCPPCPHYRCCPVASLRKIVRFCCKTTCLPLLFQACREPMRWRGGSSSASLCWVLPSRRSMKRPC